MTHYTYGMALLSGDKIMLSEEQMMLLINKHKPNNYLTCSPEEAFQMTEYVKDKISKSEVREVYDLLEIIEKCSPPDHDDFELIKHYNELYADINITKYPSYQGKNLKYGCNIKNFYDANQYMNDENSVSRCVSIFNRIADPSKGLPNKALFDLSRKCDITFKIISGTNFDGECRYIQPEEKSKPAIAVVITQKALEASDDSLAVLLGHELSHAIDINRRPFGYNGSIGWEAPEDFANIVGSQIAQNAGYDPREFIKSQGVENEKTQRAAEMILKYSLDPFRLKCSRLHEKIKNKSGETAHVETDKAEEKKTQVNISQLIMKRKKRFRG